MKQYTVKKHLESYGSIYLDYEGNETDRPCRMSLKQANYLAKCYNGYVKELFGN